MAIDTPRKRASVLSYALAPETLVVPQSGVPQADQQTINHVYAGILATAVVAPVRISNALMLALHRLMGR